MKSLREGREFCKFMLSSWKVCLGLGSTLIMFLAGVILFEIEGDPAIVTYPLVSIMSVLVFIMGGFPPVLEQIYEWKLRKEILKRINFNGHAPLKI